MSSEVVVEIRRELISCAFIFMPFSEQPKGKATMSKYDKPLRSAFVQKLFFRNYWDVFVNVEDVVS